MSTTFSSDVCPPCQKGEHGKHTDEFQARATSGPYKGEHRIRKCRCGCRDLPWEARKKFGKRG